MGVKPPLPAPTESSTLQTSGGSGTEADLATEVSRRTDHTSYSIPEDGSPLTFPTKKRREHRDKDRETALTKASHHSQTSLLIEYFEAGKGPNVHTRPSVRVKVTPSAARKIKDSNEHIQVTETRGSRKPSYTRRISLGPRSAGDKRGTESTDDKSTSSYTSAAEESSLAHRQPPVEIEVMHRDEESDISGPSIAREERYTHVNPSDISSMPPDSMLDEKAGTATPKRRPSRSESRDAVVNTDTLKTPSRRRSRSLSKERLAHKAMEKLAYKPREVSSGKHKRSSKTRSRSVSNETVEDIKSRRRRSSKSYQEDELPSGADSSILTASQFSPRRQSGDQYSFRSGTSKSSINANPRLLETVENAIRRLIMPELETLKQEQKMQQSRQKFERGHRDSITSGSSASRIELSRKLSKHASAPDVSGKPKVFLNRDDTNAGTLLSGDSIKGRKESRRDRNSDSPSERRSEREMSEETVIRDGEVSRKKSRERHRLRDTAAGGIAGGVLTAAALNHHDLKHHDSRSSIDRRERRKRRSKSRSRSASLAESAEDVFTKHDVPPMPMRSDIQSSEITRDSILSDRTEETLSPTEGVRMAEIRHVSRGSPREVFSPASRVPTKSPLSMPNGLGTHHSNLSRGDLAEQSPRSDRSFHDEEHHSKMVEAGVMGASAGATALTAHHLADRDDRYDQNYSYQHENRGLSPIQSVSSRQESEINRESFHRKHSSGSLASLTQQRKKGSASSMRSLASPISVDMAPSNRPKGINFEPGEDVLDQHGLRDSNLTEGEYSDRDPAMDEWLEQEHEKNDRYRDSGSYRDSMIDYRHMTNYTDDSLDAPYLDRVTAAQERQTVGASRNPDYRSTPEAVESAVASLLDTSVLSSRSKPGDKSYAGSHDDERRDASLERESAKIFKEQLHENHSPTKINDYDGLSAKGSPRQSIARSLEAPEEQTPMGASGLPIADDPLPEIGHGLHSEDSEISTNPSIIQGPIGGYQNDNLDHWPNKPTPPKPSKGELLAHSKNSSAQVSLKAAAASFLTAAALAGQGSQGQQTESQDLSIRAGYQPSVEEEYGDPHRDLSPVRDSYMSGHAIASPPKDEGYISGPQHGPPSPEVSFKNAKSFNDHGMDGSGEDDPFISRSQAKHMSIDSQGLAHGMGSPMYDSATGGGIDRIQSKDIVALMDHLTVRDAQRNARDTEILVTLVRSAAEMRNSFEEMKKFIAEQDDILVEAGNKQHDRTVQKIVLGGPRPQPLGTPRFPRRSSDDDAEDSTAKRRNVFRRALKGLSSRNQNDIGKIEEMLVHLLGEVEGLRASQDIRPIAGVTRVESMSSYNNIRAAGPDGYEPEGQAGTGSTGQSEYFSNPPSREASATRNREARFGSQNRVSTVLEADEEFEAHEQEGLDHQVETNEQLLTPTKENTRAGSVPLNTPPQIQLPAGTQSHEHTPRTNTDKSRKHKSSSSSFFPKISRWSRTTASSAGDNFKSNRQQRPLSEASRSGSDLRQYDTHDHYDPRGDDRLRSNDSLENDGDNQEDRPPSPLIPSQVSDDPKYQAHRNSLNLQHPQPRPGPTHRFQHQLESQARNFSSGSPVSPTSDTFGSDPTLARYVPGASNRYSGTAGNLSPISDARSARSAAERASAPPRPPKVKDDGPLIPSGPSRPLKLATKDNRPTFASPLSSEHLQPDQRYSNGSSYDPAKGSPRSASGAVPQRKPTGPRPITSSGSYSPGKGDGK